MAVPIHEVHYLEIVTPNAESVRNHYSEAYGWQFREMAPELGNAYVATLPNGSLCAIRAPLHAQELAVTRTYLRVPDVEKSLNRAVELGGVLMLGATELPGRGIIGIYNYEGIEQGVWQV